MLGARRDLVKIDYVVKETATLKQLVQETHVQVDLIRQERAEAFLLSRDVLTLPSFENRIEQAQEIAFTGVSLLRAINEYGDLFKRKLREEKCKLKFLLLSPESPATRLAEANVSISYDVIKSDIQASIEHLKELKQLVSEEDKRTIEVRFLKCVPAYSSVIIDPELPSGSMIVELFAYKSKLRARPHFELSRARDPFWWAYFYNAFQRLWSDSKPW